MKMLEKIFLPLREWHQNFGGILISDYQREGNLSISEGGMARDQTPQYGMFVCILGLKSLGQRFRGFLALRLVSLWN